MNSINNEPKSGKGLGLPEGFLVSAGIQKTLLVIFFLLCLILKVQDDGLKTFVTLWFGTNTTAQFFCWYLVGRNHNEDSLYKGYVLFQLVLLLRNAVVCYLLLWFIKEMQTASYISWS